MKTIYIIGAGAIGKVLSVSLKLAGREVILLRGSLDDGLEYIETIHVQKPGGTTLTADVKISTLSAIHRLDGILVLTSKSYANARLAALLSGRAGRLPLVLLQNGLGVEQAFIDKGFAEIYRGVLFVTSQAISANELRYQPVSASLLGGIKGSTAGQLNAIVNELNTAHFSFRAENDIQPVIWKKAIINAVFNSVCPLLETDNGIFCRNEEALKLAERIIAECMLVAREQGIALNTAEVTESLLLISSSSAGQLISTLQDIRNKKETEIDTLNLEIARIAGRLHIESQLKETRLLGELVRLKSALGRQQTG